MSWIFALALGLVIFGVLCLASSVGVAVDDGGGGVVGVAVIFGVMLLAAGLLTFQSATMNEVNCYRDGGQVIDTQCMVVKGAVNGND